MMAYGPGLDEVSSSAEGPHIQPFLASPQRRVGPSLGAQPIRVPYNGLPSLVVPYNGHPCRSQAGPLQRQRVRLARAFRPPGHCSPHIAHLLATPQEEDTLVPAWLLQRLRVPVLHSRKGDSTTARCAAVRCSAVYKNPWKVQFYQHRSKHE